jgi:hypothetical protein
MISLGTTLSRRLSVGGAIINCIRPIFNYYNVVYQVSSQQVTWLPLLSYESYALIPPWPFVSGNYSIQIRTFPCPALTNSLTKQYSQRCGQPYSCSYCCPCWPFLLWRSQQVTLSKNLRAKMPFSYRRSTLLRCAAADSPVPAACRQSPN